MDEALVEKADDQTGLASHGGVDGIAGEEVADEGRSLKDTRQRNALHSGATSAGLAGLQIKKHPPDPVNFPAFHKLQRGRAVEGGIR